MNENVLNFLNFYSEDTDPQYAVLLDGKWGCGKTFFVQKWLSLQKKHPDGEIVPIYISLFGLKTIEQVNTSINNVLFPILNSKVYKIGKGLCKAVVSGVLKYNLDVDNNGSTDATVDFKLDPIMALLQNPNDEIKGHRLMVFDDIERTQINMTELLGYVNRFVERNKFKVVLICNALEIKEKDVFERFREKIIGRTFEILPEVDEAINFFVHEEPVCYFTQQNVELIKYAFYAVGYSNLRVLRQCIRDFNNIFQSVTYEQGNQFHHKVLREFLVRFVVLYSEMSTDNKYVIATSFLAADIKRDSRKSQSLEEQANMVRRKYADLELRLGIDIFNDVNEVSLISAYFIRGCDISCYLNERLIPKDRPSWDYLYEYYDLSNEEFLIHYKEICKDIMRNHFQNYQDALKAIFIVIEMNDLGIKKIEDNVLQKSKQYIRDLLIHQTEGEAYLEIRTNLTRILSSVNENNPHRDLRKQFWTEINVWLNECQKSIENKYQEILNHLSDANIQELIECSDKSLPEGRTYQYYPVFRTCSPQKVANGILTLSNRSKAKFSRFLNSRYRLDNSYNLDSNLWEDVPVLLEVRDTLKKHIDRLVGVDRYDIQHLIELCDKIEKISNKKQ